MPLLGLGLTVVMKGEARLHGCPSCVCRWSGLNLPGRSAVPTIPFLGFGRAHWFEILIASIVCSFYCIDSSVEPRLEIDNVQESKHTSMVN
jgi:hypothetical protein